MFGPAPRVELLEGVIVESMTKNPPHNLVSDLVDDYLRRLIPAGYFLSVDTLLSIENRDSEPEPDAMVLRGQLRDYTARRRVPGDAALVIEIADTSYEIDRFEKWRTYAGAGVPIFWILDLNRGRLEVHHDPKGTGEQAHYAVTRLFDRDDEAPLILDGREVARLSAKEIFP